ncbi:MAG TPA: hypothetical protein VLR26_18635 [Frankiaceae bacterium]|nr:hypothetical protein [Frankiaceae bacterium]
MSVEIAGGRIEIGSRRGRDVRVRVTVAVTGWRARIAPRRPPVVPAARLIDGALQLRGRSGQIRVQVDVPAGLPVEAEVGSGDVTLWGVGGLLRLHVGSGILAGRELGAGSAEPAETAGTDVTATNDDGEVNLHFAARPTAVDARSTTGPVLLVLPGGAYRLDTDGADEVTVTHDAHADSIIRSRSGGRSSVLSATGSEAI